MKVLNVCRDDWSNFMYDNMKSLKAVGVNCDAVKLSPHLFHYTEEAKVRNEKIIHSMIDQADVIQIFHSDTTFLGYCVSRFKKIIVYHTGSVYRDNPSWFNEKFNQHVNRSVIALGEFYESGAKNETYIVGAIPTDYEIKYSSKHPYNFAHYPSNPKVKGTSRIINTMAFFDDHRLLNFEWSTIILDYPEQVKRMQRCDVYVELLMGELNGKKYGSFGMTALEAAAMGKIVLTMNNSLEVYEKHYGKCPFLLHTDELSLATNIMKLMMSTPAFMNQLKKETRDWVVRNHSYEATGKYILKNILN